MIACGRVLTVVCLAIAQFLSRPPPATPVVRDRFLTGGLLIVSAFPSIACLRVFPGYIARQAVQRCGSGF